MNILGWNSGQLNNLHLRVTGVCGNDQKGPDKIHNDSRGKKHNILGDKTSLIAILPFWNTYFIAAAARWGANSCCPLKHNDHQKQKQKNPNNKALAALKVREGWNWQGKNPAAFLCGPHLSVYFFKEQTKTPPKPYRALACRQEGQAPVQDISLGPSVDFFSVTMKEGVEHWWSLMPLLNPYVYF